MSPVILDVRGMRCPWPALRLARAMRAMPSGGAVIVMSDDAKAEGEIVRLAESNGWSCAIDRDRGDPRFTIRS